MTPREIKEREAGEDIVLQYVDDTASAPNAANITGRMAALAQGTFKIGAAPAAVIAFPAPTFRAAVGDEDEPGYVAKGYDFTLPGADSADAPLTRYRFDYRDTTDGSFVSEPCFIELVRAASLQETT